MRFLKIREQVVINSYLSQLPASIWICFAKILQGILDNCCTISAAAVIPSGKAPLVAIAVADSKELL